MRFSVNPVLREKGQAFAITQPHPARLSLQAYRHEQLYIFLLYFNQRNLLNAVIGYQYSQFMQT